MKCFLCDWICADFGKEKESPEGLSVDVEHDGAGKPLSKWNPRYWVSVFAEAIFDGPCYRYHQAQKK